jgi:hypothetical protein
VTFQLRNTGNQPIAKAAFDGPLSLVFDPSVKLLTASVVSVKPESLEPIASIAVADGLSRDSNAPQPWPPRLEIQPLSLNPAASFTVEFLVDGAAAPTRLLGNVVGVVQFVELPDEGPLLSSIATATRRSRRLELASLIAVGAGLGVAVLSGLGVLSAGLGVVGLVYGGKHNTRVVLSAGGSICASEYRLTDRGITAVAEGSGQVVNIPDASVRAIRRDAC